MCACEHRCGCLAVHKCVWDFQSRRPWRFFTKKMQPPPSNRCSGPDPDQEVGERQEALRHYLFDCRCVRCVRELAAQASGSIWTPPAVGCWRKSFSRFSKSKKNQHYGSRDRCFFLENFSLRLRLFHPEGDCPAEGGSEAPKKSQPLLVCQTPKNLGGIVIVLFSKEKKHATIPEYVYISHQFCLVS